MSQNMRQEQGNENPALLVTRRARLKRRLSIAALVLAVLAIVFRAALPEILRRVAVDQADTALVGRIEIEDIDLALLAGGITVHGLRVYAHDLPSPEEQRDTPAASETAPPESDETASGGGAEPPPNRVSDIPAATSAPGATVAAASASTGQAEPKESATNVNAVTSDSAISTTESPPADSPAPILTASRLSVDIGWKPLLDKIVAIEAIELEHFAANIERLKDGSLVLPAPVPSEPKPEDPPPAEPEGPGWGLLLQRLSLRDGHVAFRDFTVGENARPLEASIPSLEAANMSLLITDTGLQPGTASLEADVLGGHLRFELTQRNVASGQAFESHVVLTDLPIGDALAYVPQAEWTALDGRLDIDLVHNFDPEGPHGVRGSVALRDLAIRVSGMDKPPLAWKKLGIDIGEVDLVKHDAKIALVSLEGARVIARATGPEPLPVLRGLMKEAKANTPPPPRAPASQTPGAGPGDAGQPIAGPPGTGPVNAAPNDDPASAPWTWQLDKVSLRDTGVEVLGGDAPIAVGIDADVSGLASAAKTRSKIDLKVKPPVGDLALDGAFTIDPLGFDGTLKLEAVALAPLSAPVATPMTRLLREGTLSTNLKIALGAAPSAPPEGAQVSGTISLDSFAITGEDDKAFAIRWQQLALDIQSLTAAGILSKETSSAAAKPIELALASFTFERPEIVVTRAESGIVLPTALGGSGETGGQGQPAAQDATTGSQGAPAAPREATTTGQSAPAARQDAATTGQGAPAAQDAATTTGGGTEGAAAQNTRDETSASPVDVRVAHLAIKRMRIAVTDKTVKPLYRTNLDPIDFSADDVRWPGPYASAVNLAAKGLDGAKLTVTGDVAPNASQLKAKLEGMPLAPFHPYAALAGYGIGGGRASLRSDIKMKADSYKTDNRLVLNKLQVTGAEGDSMFAQQFGMPLSLALALMTDLQGNITLNLPVAGDRGGTNIGIGTALRDALKQAILSTATSPLKLIGAVADIGQKPASLTPQPIAFKTGRALEAEGESDKVDTLAKFLSSSPVLALRLHGEAGDEDRRWLAEQKALAALEKETGLINAMRHIGEGDEREAALAFLRARAEDKKPPELDEKQKAWMEAKVTAQTVTDAELRTLAEQRAETLRQKLSEKAGVKADRIVLDPIAPEDLAARSLVSFTLETATPVKSPQAAGN